MSSNPIFTIGYGARDMGAFLAVLEAYGIEYLVDIRTSPYSKYKPEFSKNALKYALEAQGIRYVFMGDRLGGQPKERECYTGGKVDYEKVARQPFFQEGIEQVTRAWEEGRRMALMCAEGKPQECHRSKLVGKVLEAEGMEVLHIDEVDEMVSQKEVILRLTDGQLSLFGDDFLTFTSRKRYREEEESEDS